MMNLVKFDLSGFQFDLNNNLTPGSAFDDSAASGNLAANQNTTKAGVGGSGTGLEIRFNTNATPEISTYTVTNSGKGYLPGDTITFSFTAADSIATGSFDITFDPVAGDGFYEGGCGQNENIKSKKGFFDADSVVGILDPQNGLGLELVTTIRAGASASQPSKTLSILFQATGMDDTADARREVSRAISLCVADAKRNPKSIPDLVDYLPSGVTIANYTYKVP
ncbi:MAG: hypothetical protein ACR2M9_00035 [Cyanophyceae cyanobacterium]